MPAPDRDHPSPDSHPSKRPRQSSPDKESPASLPSAGATSPAGDRVHDGLLGHGGGGGGGGAAAGINSGGGSKIGQSSSFRNVSACNRCRLRKNRCDQKLPSCASCEKANVPCVGYDPISKRELPRSYTFYLEKRVEQLEALLAANDIAFPPAEDLDYCSKVRAESNSIRSPTEAGQSSYSECTDAASSGRPESNGDGLGGRPQRLASKPGSSAGPAVTSNRYLGSTAGISFARVVFAAVQSSVSDQKSNSDKGGVRPSGPAPGGNGATEPGQTTSMRDSFFGLHAKPTLHPAPFPDKELGLRLISLYFEHANPQIPVLHKGEFMEMFERTYAGDGRRRGPRELYVLNMVFAIGAGVIVGDSKGHVPPAGLEDSSSSRQCRPEEYHASAMIHLEACIGSGAGLEDLQAVLLLANFALLRPVPPGLWYIIGEAVRRAVDLGLHYEDGKDLEAGFVDASNSRRDSVAKEKGRREYVRDMRRRLWWCTYSLDRLVSLCVGRPFGIPDHVITTEFPSLLEDRYITAGGLIQPPPEMLRPTYKLVAHHYFRLRLLQSEILQVLQFRQAQSARASGQNSQNPYMHTDLPSPFLAKFDSFRSWRIDIDRRLWEWKNSAPMKEDTGVAFSIDFFGLNYWQTIIVLYRQSLSVPTVFEGEYDTAKEVDSPAVYNAELREDEDRVYLKVAEAGQKIMRLYRQLHLLGVVNYTYLTTHHLFVAGISYLYAIWHSPIVRSRLTMDEVDFTILAATSVFTDFMDKCPPAEACRDAFNRTVKATLKMVNQTGGFGQQYQPTPASAASSSRNNLDHRRFDWSTRSGVTSLSSKPPYKRHRQHPSSAGQTSAATSDVYSTAPWLASAFPKGASYRIHGNPTVKTEADGFPLMRNTPVPPRSDASSTDDIKKPVTPEATAPIDQPMLRSPSALQQQKQQQLHHRQQHPTSLSSPIGEMMSQPLATGAAAGGFLSPRHQQQQPQQPPPSRQQQQFSPGTIQAFNDMQGLDFLQNVQMDIPGFNVGYEGGGSRHDLLGDGQHLQLGLFDDFFFGGGVQAATQTQTHSPTTTQTQQGQQGQGQ
ncbi:hypothetical protein N657DRAFT_614675 [Parathielavia appendiculata]|uniref:Zn(2)-C6 fungal-type domain-containing protein n=1 Tax=Parathielavia appendiculata TaxID=2587402 RepID=A0AAN6U488_9PEZI|nr:hypothetical protein N657DRAFT_614675 [Parathielavia appendiculata]